MRAQNFTIVFCTSLLVGCRSIATPVAASMPSTPAPQITATPPAATVTSTPTQDAQATEFWVTSTAIVEAIVAGQRPNVYETYSSPDMNWQAKVVIYDCIKIDQSPGADTNAYEQLTLTNVSGGEERPIDSQLQNCGGLGAAGLEVLLWSSNSRYLYYTDSRAGVPDGCGYWQKPLLRVDVQTLEREELGGGVFSPDGLKLATGQGEELVIWDVNKGSEMGRIFPYALNTETGTGPIIWSPDSRALIYIQTASYCPLSGGSAIVRVDLSTLEQTILLESETPTFGAATWNMITELNLIDEHGDPWVYTFEDQELKPLP